MVGIGPDADGRWHDKAVSVLLEAGEWIRANQEAIYATRPWRKDLYHEGEVYYTASKDGRYLYAICLDLKDDVIRLNYPVPKKDSHILLLGSRSQVDWEIDENGELDVCVPEDVHDAYFVLRIEMDDMQG